MEKPAARGVLTALCHYARARQLTLETKPRATPGKGFRGLLGMTNPTLGPKLSEPGRWYSEKWQHFSRRQVLLHRVFVDKRPIRLSTGRELSLAATEACSYQGAKTGSEPASAHHIRFSPV